MSVSPVTLPCSSSQGPLKLETGRWHGQVWVLEWEVFEFLARELPELNLTFFFFFFCVDSGSLAEVFLPFFFSFFSLSFFSEGRKPAS